MAPGVYEEVSIWIEGGLAHLRGAACPTRPPPNTRPTPVLSNRTRKRRPILSPDFSNEMTRHGCQHLILGHGTFSSDIFSARLGVFFFWTTYL
jgi:hypothetical protein